MRDEQNPVNWLYRQLVHLYPRAFREQLADSMQQTFHDLCMEKMQTKNGWFGFVLWTFLETGIGILREHLRLISPGAIMQTIPKAIGSSALISLVVLVPFIVMEIVNRRQFNEDFPIALFFAMWLNVFAVSVILLPIVRGRWMSNQGTPIAIPTLGQTRFTKPGSAAIVSILVFLAPGILPLLESFGLLTLDRLFNGPNPEVTYLPGLFMTVGLLFFPIAAGVIAGLPIVDTLRGGGSLFAHRINLILVVLISSAFAFGFTALLIDQWPCFIGVPVCD